VHKRGTPRFCHLRYIYEQEVTTFGFNQGKGIAGLKNIQSEDKSVEAETGRRVQSNGQPVIDSKASKQSKGPMGRKWRHLPQPFKNICYQFPHSKAGHTCHASSKKKDKLEKRGV